MGCPRGMSTDVESDQTAGPGKLMSTIPQVCQLVKRFGRDGKVGRRITRSSPWGWDESEMWCVICCGVGILPAEF
jgi:hypothetical protein